MGFKKLKGVPLPEEEQGLIRYTCLTWQNQPARTRRKIQRLCVKCGGAYRAALWEVMCTTGSVREIAGKHYVSERTLYDARKKFYEAWGKTE